MKNLGNLKPAKGSNKNTKRLGRGPGSGHGKTAAKGHKGQKARSGGKVAAGFEGGQTPLYRRLPKRGFKNANKVTFQIVTLGDLNTFENNAKVDLAAMVEKKLIKSAKSPVKLLANGSLEKSLTLGVHKASKAAKESVEKAGGKVEEIA